VIGGLEYLDELGIDAIWLSPFYPSPLRDSGYDVSDPRAVDPMYGNVDDFRELVAQAHARSIRVIVDVVPNHVSDQHRWFQEALGAAPGSVERARFHFREGRDGGQSPPNNWASLFGGAAWTRITEPDGAPGQWYLHLFDSSQPDLNWSNAEVREDALATLRFWLDLGVDGFRIDVALGLAKDMTYPDVEDPVGITEALRFDLDDGSVESQQRRAKVPNSAFFDRDELRDIYREWRQVLDSYPGDRMTVAEAWLPPHRIGNYVAPDGLHQVFGFDFLVAPWDADRMRITMEAAISAVEAVGATPTWALSNHDSPRVVSRLGGGAVGSARARALAMLVQALPGSVYIYQGEELGLADAELPDSARDDPVFFRTHGAQKGRDACRVPLPWSGTAPPYGFTDSISPLWLPQPSDWAEVTVAAEEADPESSLHLFRQALHLRHHIPNVNVQFDDWGEGILALRRGDFHCLMNASEVAIELPAGEVILRSLPGNDSVLAPNTTVWMRAPKE
jgi:alpha-glucosidase